MGPRCVDCAVDCMTPLVAAAGLSPLITISIPVFLRRMSVFVASRAEGAKRSDALAEAYAQYARHSVQGLRVLFRLGLSL